MVSGENFCLQWNEFQNNVKTLYRGVRKSEEYADVTLASEDGYHIKAHRIILSSSSLFFRDTLASLTHSQPMVYMRGVKHRNLSNIIDFIYHGEAEVMKEDLEIFLDIAGELGVKGMTKPVLKPRWDRKSEGEIDNDKFLVDSMALAIDEDGEFQDFAYNYSKKLQTRNAAATVQAGNIEETEQDESVLIETEAVFDNTGEDNVMLEEKIDTMVEKRDGMWTCMQCGKFDISKFGLRGHVETHIEGFTHLCPKCKKAFSTRGALRVHKGRQHPKKRTPRAKPFNCNICDKPSESLAAVRAHKSRKHKN